MKIIISLIVALFCLTGFSFGGECTNGFCNRSSGRSVSTAKSVVKERVRVAPKVVAGLNSRRVTRVR